MSRDPVRHEDALNASVCAAAPPRATVPSGMGDREASSCGLIAAGMDLNGTLETFFHGTLLEVKKAVEAEE